MHTQMSQRPSSNEEQRAEKQWGIIKVLLSRFYVEFF